ncbi:hypothetical protein EOL94_01715 [bacterium]|nr:hypothetical protein [bacterium]
MKKFVLFMILLSASLFFAGCEKEPVEPVDPEPPAAVYLNIKVEANCNIGQAAISIPIINLDRYSLDRGETYRVCEDGFALNYQKCYNEEVFFHVAISLDLSNTGDGPYITQYKTMTKLMDDLEEDIYFFFDYNDGDMRE